MATGKSLASNDNRLRIIPTDVNVMLLISSHYAVLFAMTVRISLISMWTTRHNEMKDDNHDAMGQPSSGATTATCARRDSVSGRLMKHDSIDSRIE